jgi:hypothetical protein
MPHSTLAQRVNAVCPGAHDRYTCFPEWNGGIHIQTEARQERYNLGITL